MKLKKFKVLFDKDYEQDWLNEMCAQGWALESFFAGLYTFIPCEPGEYIYQIDLLPGMGLKPEDPEGYVTFMEETGVEVLQLWGRWSILRKRSEEGPFEIYTDAFSQIQLYNRIRKMFGWALGIELLCSLSLWPQLSNSPWLWPFAVFYAAIFAAIVAAIVRCTRRIRQLDPQEPKERWHL